MIAPFGSLDGVEVSEVTLANSDGMEMRVLTWGAAIRDLIVPTSSGPQHVLLGLNTIEDYAAHSPYFGAIVGRYANRIGRARFTLDGETYVLDANEGRNQLHGGSKGFGTRVWTIVDLEPSGVTLALVSADGDMGYPGRLIATCTYSLHAPAILRVALEAITDKRTPVNLTSHAYFNLDGSPDTCSHHLMIAADFITPTRPDLIPTGAIKSVVDTPYDFTVRRPVGAAQLLSGRVSYDMNYVLRAPGDSLSHAATLASLKNGLAMELWTTEPGLQFYDGHMLDVPVRGLSDAHYGPHSGLCLEPQRFPDGPNKAHFPPHYPSTRHDVSSDQRIPIRFSLRNRVDRWTLILAVWTAGTLETIGMPVLDAEALERDPKGAAFLLSILRYRVPRRAASDDIAATDAVPAVERCKKRRRRLVAVADLTP